MHRALNLALPIGVFLVVVAGLTELAVIAIVISKWQVFAIKPRHFIANLRSNAIDIVVNLSILWFMIDSATVWGQAAWAVWYAIWLNLLKPRSSVTMVALQAVIGQSLGLSVIAHLSDTIPELTVVAGAWVVGVVSARHFLSSYGEDWSRPIAYIWGLFVAKLSWILYRWLLIYTFVPQIVLVTMTVGYLLASIYHHSKSGNLKPSFVRQQLVMALLVLSAVVALGDWSGRV